MRVVAVACQVQPNIWELMGVVSEVGSCSQKWLPSLWNVLVSNPNVLKTAELKVSDTCSAYRTQVSL